MILDTNILIAFLEGDETVIKSILDWKNHSKILFIPSIAYTEVLAFPNLTENQWNIIRNALDENFIVLPLDKILAEFSARVKVKYGLKIADAVIVATAIYTGVPLVTRDKEMLRIREIRSIEI